MLVSTGYLLFPFMDPNSLCTVDFFFLGWILVMDVDGDTALGASRGELLRGLVSIFSTVLLGGMDGDEARGVSRRDLSGECFLFLAIVVDGDGEGLLVVSLAELPSGFPLDLVLEADGEGTLTAGEMSLLPPTLSWLMAASFSSISRFCRMSRSRSSAFSTNTIDSTGTFSEFCFRRPKPNSLLGVIDRDRPVSAVLLGVICIGVGEGERSAGFLRDGVSERARVIPIALLLPPLEIDFGSAWASLSSFSRKVSPEADLDRFSFVASPSSGSPTLSGVFTYDLAFPKVCGLRWITSGVRGRSRFL